MSCEKGLLAKAQWHWAGANESEQNLRFQCAKPIVPLMNPQEKNSIAKDLFYACKDSISEQKKYSIHFELISNSYSLKHDVKLNLNQVAAQSLAACLLFCWRAI